MIVRSKRPPSASPGGRSRGRSDQGMAPAGSRPRVAASRRVEGLRRSACPRAFPLRAVGSRASHDRRTPLRPTDARARSDPLRSPHRRAAPVRERPSPPSSPPLGARGRNGTVTTTAASGLRLAAGPMGAPGTSRAVSAVVRHARRTGCPGGRPMLASVDQCVISPSATKRFAQARSTSSGRHPIRQALEVAGGDHLVDQEHAVEVGVDVVDLRVALLQEMQQRPLVELEPLLLRDHREDLEELLAASARRSAP